MGVASDSRPPVAQLVETLSVGGAERLAVQIASAMADSGHRSHLYVLGGPGALSSTVPETVSVRYFELKRSSVKSPPGFIASLLRGRRRLVDAIREDGVEVLQSHLPGANFWGLLLQVTGAVQVVPTIHNNREFDYGDADHPLRARFRRSAYRQMIRSCAGVVAVSELVRESMVQQLGLDQAAGASLTVVPNGVPVPDPAPRSTLEAIKDRFGVDGDTRLLLAAGRHTDQKNFCRLIEAASGLRTRGIPFRLVIAGEGELFEEHEALVRSLDLEDHVVLPGNLSDLRDVMQAADLFVLPSKWEGLPLVLLEAMAAGCAVVGTDIPGIAEVLQDGVTGRVVPSDDAEAMTEALDDLISNPTAREQLARSALELVSTRYSFERVAADLGDLYARTTIAKHFDHDGTP